MAECTLTPVASRMNLKTDWNLHDNLVSDSSLCRRWHWLTDLNSLTRKASLANPMLLLDLVQDTGTAIFAEYIS